MGVCFCDMLRSTVVLWGISVVTTDIVLRKNIFFLIINTSWTSLKYKLFALKLLDFCRKFNVGERYFRYRRRNTTGNYKNKVGNIRRERNQAAGTQNAVSLCPRFLLWLYLFSFFSPLTIFPAINVLRFSAFVTQFGLF